MGDQWFAVIQSELKIHDRKGQANLRKLHKAAKSVHTPLLICLFLRLPQKDMLVGRPPVAFSVFMK